MERHGSESYFVLGEGMLGESVGGRTAEFTSRRADTAAAAEPFRFSRMGPRGNGKQLGDAALERLGRAMIGGGGRSRIPAGFTYLGQFVDHDLTFDKTDVMLGENVSPADLLQGRSPSLDLDSMYGAGPNDPGSERFYEADKIHLKMGRTQNAGGVRGREDFDLPRGAGSGAQRKKAIIPDPRNDENLAVAQTHLAMIRFHNRVVDNLPNSVPPSQRFNRARNIVTRHYQWMLRTDYLPRICSPRVVGNVFRNGRKAFEVGAPPNSMPTMPLEFSVAAFRLGHSMIRAAYNWNRAFDNGAGTLDWLFIFSAGSGNLGGGRRLAADWTADFRRLFDLGETGRRNLEVPEGKFNRAMRIDTNLVNPLSTLPGPDLAPERNLAVRNLRRAKMVQLATGQQMVRFLRNKGVNVTKLTDRQIREGRDGADLGDLTQAQRRALLRDTPLWFYVLREAEFNRGRLDGVGARIVAETFHRAIQGSRTSIVRDPSWRPHLGPNDRTFRMSDLLVFAFRGRRNLLAPVG